MAQEAETRHTAGIKRLAEMSRTPQRELIVDCLDFRSFIGTRELTAEQIEKFITHITKARTTTMSKKRKWQYTKEELNIHEEAVKLRKMTDKQLYEKVYGDNVGAGSPLVGQEAPEDANPKENATDVKKLLNGLAEGQCKGIKGATVYKIEQYAAEMGLI